MAIDEKKVGCLLQQLRKEQGLSQQALADILHVSNKTISKWECNHGIPDASLWDAISQHFHVDLQQLINGELHVKQTDIGKMDRIQFYVCPSCGNVMTSITKANVTCCGRVLSPCIPKHSDSQHAIQAQEVEGDIYITLPHAMCKQHYISFVAYVRSDMVILYRLYPEQEAAFRIPGYGRKGHLYLNCTVHGFMAFDKL